MKTLREIVPLNELSPELLKRYLKKNPYSYPHDEKKRRELWNAKKDKTIPDAWRNAKNRLAGWERASEQLPKKDKK